MYKHVCPVQVVTVPSTGYLRHVLKTLYSALPGKLNLEDVQACVSCASGHCTINRLFEACTKDTVQCIARQAEPLATYTAHSQIPDRAAFSFAGLPRH